MSEGKERELTPEELAQLRAGNSALMSKIKVRASAVVRGADGKLKYDNPDNVGNYHEENLK